MPSSLMCKRRGDKVNFGPGFPLLSFRRKMVKRSPPEENFGQAFPPPEPEKIARYLVLSTQRKAKNRGSKKLPPKTPFSGRFTRVVRKFFFEPKIFGKIDFYCIFRPLFSRICQNFLSRHLRRRFSGPSGPKMVKRPPPLMGKNRKHTFFCFRQHRERRATWSLYTFTRLM